MLLIKAHELSPLPSPFLSFPAVLPLLRMQLPRNPWVTLRKGVSSLVDANNTVEKNNKCRTICLMKSLTFYFISPYCILKEVNRKTFANYTTVYWLLGRLLSYLSELLACCAVPASAFSFLPWARGAQQEPWVLSQVFEPFTSEQLPKGRKCAASLQAGNLGKVVGPHPPKFEVICWANERVWKTLPLRLDVGREWMPFPFVGPGFCAQCLGFVLVLSKLAREALANGSPSLELW